MTKITTDAQALAVLVRIAQDLGSITENDATGLHRYLRARLASTSPAPDGWQSIETAPKNGRDIQVYCSSSNEQFSAYWHIGREVWCYAITREGVIIACNPTHWRRQAAAPQPVVEKDNG